MISTIVAKVRKQPKLLDELVAVREEKEQFSEKVIDGVVEMYKAKEYFSSVEHMRTKLKEQFGLHLKPWKLMHILQHHLGMRYRKVKAISWQANSPNDLILRQQFA